MRLRFWIEGPGSFVLAILLALVVRWAFLEAYMIPSNSMTPTLLKHDHIFVNKAAYGVRWPFSQNWLMEWNSPKRGDVIVFRKNSNSGSFYLKRVIGVPGDRVYIDKGNIYLNESLIERRAPTSEEMRDFELTSQNEPDHSPWIQSLGEKKFSVLYRKVPPTTAPLGPIEVPFDHYFVVGDHRDSSDDSRTWEEDRFVSRESIMGRASIIWLSCDETLPGIPVLCHPLKIRGSRLFKIIH